MHQPILYRCSHVFFNASWCSAVVEFTVKYCKGTHHYKKCLRETVIEGSGWLQVFVDKIHIVFKILQKELLKWSRQNKHLKQGFWERRRHYLHWIYMYYFCFLRFQKVESCLGYPSDLCQCNLLCSSKMPSLMQILILHYLWLVVKWHWLESLSSHFHPKFSTVIKIFILELILGIYGIIPTEFELGLLSNMP